MPDFENGAPKIEVLYMCDAKHVTPINFHAQVKDFPKSWNCQTCHAKAKYVASANTPTDEYVPDPKKLSVEMREGFDVEEENLDIPLSTDPSDPSRFTFNHLQALHERRTLDELEALLEERLAILRASRHAIV